jgi:histidyl-tRNA synthetase
MDSLFDAIAHIRIIRSVETLNKSIEAQHLSGLKGASERIGELSRLINTLVEISVSDYLAIDFGIVRGFASCTGLVLESFDRSLAFRVLDGGEDMIF